MWLLVPKNDAVCIMPFGECVLFALLSFLIVRPLALRFVMTDLAHEPMKDVAKDVNRRERQSFGKRKNTERSKSTHAK